MSGGADRAADTLGALFTSAELYTGLATGAVVLVTAGLLAHRWSVVTDPGVLLGAAVVAGLAGEGRLTQAPPLALVPVVAGAALAGGLALVSVERRLAGGLAGPLLAGSALGVYFTVPETSAALVLLGVSVPAALVVVVGPAARLGVVGGVVGWGAVAWVGAAGGQYRASAVVGALGCAGLFAVEPVARAVRDGASPLDRLRGGGRAGRDRTSVPLALGAHLALVYGAARVAGLEPSGARAIVVLAAVWALGAAALALLAPTPPPDRPRTRASPG